MNAVRKRHYPKVLRYPIRELKMMWRAGCGCGWKGGGVHANPDAAHVAALTHVAAHEPVTCAKCGDRHRGEPWTFGDDTWLLCHTCLWRLVQDDLVALRSELVG